MLRNNKSLGKCLKLIESFGKISGLQVNKEKMEILHLHSTTVDRSTGNTIVITGIPYVKPQCKEQTITEFYKRKKSAVEGLTKLWRQRHLSLLGRVQVAKVHLHSQIVYPLHLHPIPPKKAGEIERLVYGFVWKGPDRIPREYGAKNLWEGGLQLPTLAHMEAGLQGSWAQRGLESSHPWTYYFKEVAENLCTIQRNEQKKRQMTHLNYPTNNRIVVAAINYMQSMVTGKKVNVFHTMHANTDIRDKSLKLLKIPALKGRKFHHITGFMSNLGETKLPWELLQDSSITAAERLRLHGELEHVKEWFATNARYRMPSQTAPDQPKTMTLLIDGNGKEVRIESLSYKEMVRLIGNSEYLQTSRLGAKAEAWLKADSAEIGLLRAELLRLPRDTRTKDFLFRLFKGLLYNVQLERIGITNCADCKWCGAT